MRRLTDCELKLNLTLSPSWFGPTQLFCMLKFQRVQNAAARLVCNAKKSDHVQPLLHQLHWLPVSSRIHYKVASICYNSVVGSGPQYLTDLLQKYTPQRQLRSSFDSRLLCIARVSTKSFGERSFSHFGPALWNNLPFDLRHSMSLTSFRRSLKTYFFLKISQSCLKN